MEIIKKIYIDYFLDEYALVTALKEMGVVVFRRTPDSVVINFVNKLILTLFNYSSDCFSEVKKNSMKF
jgi:hypothetical protein